MSDGRIVFGNPIRYFLGNTEITDEEFHARFPDKPLGEPLAFHQPGCWPMVSEASAVHPSQVAEATEFAKHHGVPTEYLPTGEPVLTSREHRKAFNKIHGQHDRRGGYGD